MQRLQFPAESDAFGPDSRTHGFTSRTNSGKRLGRFAEYLIFFFFFTLVTGPRRSLSLKLSDTRVYEPQKRARLGTTAYFCEYLGGVIEGLEPRLHDLLRRSLLLQRRQRPLRLIKHLFINLFTLFIYEFIYLLIYGFVYFRQMICSVAPCCSSDASVP